jgi:hypothetical protein
MLESIDEQYKNLLDKINDMLALMETSKDSSLKHDTETITVLSEYIREVAEYLTFVAMKYFFYTSLVDMEAGILKVLLAKQRGEDVSTVIASVLEGINNSIKALSSIFTKGDK